MKDKEKETVPIWEKVLLTVEEAAEYSNIGINKLHEKTNNPKCTYVFHVGKKKLIKRKKFEEYISRELEL